MAVVPQRFEVGEDTSSLEIGQLLLFWRSDFMWKRGKIGSRG